MKKHSFAMVFLLILMLSLIGAVSASEDVSTCDVEVSPCHVQDYAQIEIAEDYSSDGLESTVSVSDDDSQDMDVGITVSSYGSYSSYYVSTNSQEDYPEDNVGDYVSVSSDDLSFMGGHSALSVSSMGEPLRANLGSTVFVNPDLDSGDGDNQIGYDISNALGSLLNLNSAGGDIEVSVEVSEINKLAIENVLNEIVSSSNGYVINGYDNLLDLSSIKTGLINIVFIKRDKSLTIALSYADRTLLYSAGQEISASLWNKICSLSNGVLTQSLDCSEKTSEDEIYNLAYQPTEFDLPLENTSYYVLGVPRDSDADAFIWSIDNTSGKRACIGVALVNESTDGLLSQSLDDLALVSQNYGLSYSDLKQIGIDATNKALAYFKSKGINIKKGYPKLYVLTSASYVKIKGTSTESVLDGISEVLGSKKNIIPIHTPLWKDLVFYYLWVNNANNWDMLSYALKYDEATGKLVVSNDVKKQGDDIAYKMGLYDKYSPQPYPHNHGHKSVINPFEADASMVNNTNVTDNQLDNDTNDTVIIDISRKLIEDIPTAENNPYKILVVLVSIACVCIFFRLSYTKKD